MYLGDGDFDKLSTYNTACIRREDNTVGVVASLYTKFEPGKIHEDALTLGFKRLALDLSRGDTKIGIPVDIAEGNWETIKPKIVEIMEGHDVTFVEYEQ